MNPKNLNILILKSHLKIEDDNNILILKSHLKIEDDNPRQFDRVSVDL